MRVYSPEFRLQVVERIQAGEKVMDLSRELGIHRKLLYEWKRRVKEGGFENLRPRGRPRKEKAVAPIAGRTLETVASLPPSALERRIAHLRLLLEFLRQVLEEISKTNWSREERYRTIYRTIEDLARRRNGLSVKIMCDMTSVPRCGYYRYLRSRPQSDRPPAPDQLVR